MLIALGVVVVALLIFFDLVQPEYTDVMQTKGEIAAENDLYQSESQAVAAAQKIISQYQQQENGAGGTVALALPAQEDVAGAVAQVYGIAENDGIMIQSMGVSAPIIQAQSAGAASTTPMGSFSLQVSGTGSYEGFKNFVSGLETNIRILDVRNVSIAPVVQTVAKGVAAFNPDLFNFSVTVETYYQASQT